MCNCSLTTLLCPAQMHSFKGKLWAALSKASGCSFVLFKLVKRRSMGCRKISDNFQCFWGLHGNPLSIFIPSRALSSLCRISPGLGKCRHRANHHAFLGMWLPDMSIHYQRWAGEIQKMPSWIMCPSDTFLTSHCIATTLPTFDDQHHKLSSLVILLCQLVSWNEESKVARD